jgi:hypothetical protein
LKNRVIINGLRFPIDSTDEDVIAAAEKRLCDGGVAFEKGKMVEGGTYVIEFNA